MKQYSKLANTLLYLIEGCGTSPPGVTGLLKMLWFADYWHYRQNLRTITHSEYVALERGPVLDGYKELFDHMEIDGVLQKSEVPVFGIVGKPKTEYRCLMEADRSQFSESELAVLNDVIRACAGHTGSALSDRTHREGPWTFVWNANPGRRIPRSLFRWLDNLPTDDELEKAKADLSRPAVEKDLAALN